MFALHAKQVGFEFRKLARTLQRRSTHHVRNIQLRITMLARVQVEHELRKRAMQAREAAAHHREARARDFRRGFEIETAEPFAKLHVILRREIEGARRAVFAHFDIGGLVATLGHRRMQRVRQP